MSSNAEHDATEAEQASSHAPAATNRSAGRGLWMALGIAALALAGLVIGLMAYFVEPLPELTAARLEAAEELWQRQGPASYDMDLEIRGAQPGEVHIEVRGGEVTAMTRDGHAPAKRTWDTWTVPGQFETLDRELVLAEDPVHEMQAQVGTQLRLRAEFDSQYGFPRRYHRFASGGGPEVFWRVTSFEPK